MGPNNTPIYTFPLEVSAFDMMLRRHKINTSPVIEVKAIKEQ